MDKLKMKITKSITLMFIVSALSGCVPPGSQRVQNQQQVMSQAQIERNKIFQQFKFASEQAGKCSKDLLETNEDAKKLSQEIIYMSDTSPYKLELMASKKKLTAAQKALFNRAYPEMMKCREANLKNLAGSPFYSVIVDLNNRTDGIYLKLLSGEFTIGDANQAKVKSGEQLRSDITTVQNNLNSNFQAAHNREAAERQQNTQRMHEYLMQQERLRAQQQIQQSQQNMQMMQPLLNPLAPAVAPASAPRTTNCSTYGSETTCKSF